ncbi:MAG: hypothetical protein KGL25_06225 [Gammaproteobacteria bacterium]|nr:hypothetical protein [Gammaproteobacteria bacterium]
MGARIRFDAFRDDIVIAPVDTHDYRSFTDTDGTRLSIELERKGFSQISRDNMRDVVALVAERDRFDSGELWLKSLTWDGNSRVELCLSPYFSAMDSPYTRSVARYLWTAMAGRVLQPGGKADMVPVLVAMQGCGKSSGISALVPEPEPDQHVPIDLMLRDTDLSRIHRVQHTYVVARTKVLMAPIVHWAPGGPPWPGTHAPPMRSPARSTSNR